MTKAKLFIDKQHIREFPRWEIYCDVEEILRIIWDNKDWTIALIPSLPEWWQGMINITARMFELMKEYFLEKWTDKLQFNENDLALFVVKKFFQCIEELNNPFILSYKQNVGQKRIIEDEEENREETSWEETREVYINRDYWWESTIWQWATEHVTTTTATTTVWTTTWIKKPKGITSNF